MITRRQFLAAIGTSAAATGVPNFANACGRGRSRRCRGAGPRLGDYDLRAPRFNFTQTAYFGNQSSETIVLCDCGPHHFPDSWIVCGTATGETKVGLPVACEPFHIP